MILPEGCLLKRGKEDPLQDLRSMKLQVIFSRCYSSSSGQRHKQETAEGSVRLLLRGGLPNTCSPPWLFLEGSNEVTCAGGHHSWRRQVAACLGEEREAP